MSDSCRSEWNHTTLGAVVHLQRGHDLPTSARVPGDVPVVGSGDSHGWHNQAIKRGPGVVIGRATNLGRPKYIRVPYWPLNTTLYVKDFLGNHERYIYYLFRTLNLTGFDSGSVQPMLNRNNVDNVPLFLPPVSQQRAIAEVLGALDDKIEANHRLMSTARRLGSGLLQRAVSRSHEPHPLGTLVQSLSRGVTPRYAPDGQGVQVINQRCIRGGWVTLDAARRMHPTQLSAARVAQPEDVLINSTGTGTLGRLGRWMYPTRVNVDSHVTVVRPNPKACSPAVLFFCLLESQPDIEAMAEGSTGQTELNAKRLAELPVEIPTGTDVVALGCALDAIDRAAAAKAPESAHLAALRDTLLPKLISGELRVRDAEALVEGAV